MILTWVSYLLNFHFLSVLEKKPLFLGVVFNYRTIAIDDQVSSSLRKHKEKIPQN